MKISTLRRKVQKISTDLESFTQKLDDLIEGVEDSECEDMLEDIMDKIEDIIENDVPNILDHIDENLNIETEEEN